MSKVVFFGTPDFAAEALSALHAAGHTIVSVVTQPDKPKGRNREMAQSAVKRFALAHDIPVLQPLRVREADCIEALRSLEAEVFVVAAFGQILPEAVLEIPPYGCINIHASLLPRLRGAAPIQAAILEGDSQTGITIMRMDAGCDTGDILLQESIPIEETDTGGSLFDRLAALGAGMIVKALPQIVSGELKGMPQEEAFATYAGKLTKESGRIDWTLHAEQVARRIRAMHPWPGAFTSLRGKTLKIGAAVALKEGEMIPCANGLVTAKDMAGDKTPPGSVLAAAAEGIFVRTSDGVLKLTELQLEGKKRMNAKDFLNGTRLTEGEMLGT